MTENQIYVCFFYGKLRFFAALAIPVFRLAMSVCLSVNILAKFQVEAKSQHWKGLHIWNFAWR